MLQLGCICVMPVCALADGHKHKAFCFEHAAAAGSSQLRGLVPRTTDSRTVETLGLRRLSGARERQPRCTAVNMTGGSRDSRLRERQKGRNVLSPTACCGLSLNCRRMQWLVSVNASKPRSWCIGIAAWFLHQTAALARASVCDIVTEAYRCM